MSSLREVYDSYASSGLGSYSIPLHSKSLLEDHQLNYHQLLPANRDARVLDIGCGTGHFLFWLRELGYLNVLGVDVSEVAVEHCRAHGVEHVELIGNLGSFLESHPAQFDVVTMNDVIEHIPHGDMMNVLASVRESLAPGGRLIVKTLNMANPGGLYLRYADFTHLVGFTETSLRQVLLAVGFVKVEVTPYKIQTHTAKRRLWVTAQGLWRRYLKLLLLLELGADRPTILSKTLLAVAAV
jgi:2-polyprenyl-3-methyl-5-hydroxy-6-metoxy-1,4-benzoquinol methylase